MNKNESEDLGKFIITLLMKNYIIILNEIIRLIMIFV